MNISLKISLVAHSSLGQKETVGLGIRGYERPGFYPHQGRRVCEKLEHSSTAHGKVTWFSRFFLAVLPFSLDLLICSD